MTDEEYREYLNALASRHLSPLWRHDLDVRHIDHDVQRLESLTRFVRLVSERCSNPALLTELSHELEESQSVNSVLKIMERTGILAALNEAPEITFGELRRSAIPPEDIEFLRRAGIDNPDAEITITIHYARRHLGRSDGHVDRASYPSEIADQAQPTLLEAAGKLQKMASQAETPRAEAPAKKQKLFNGIGRILAGSITAAGNILVGAGTIIAPNPATLYGVIASCALAIGGIGQGIGDLRGE